MVLHICDAFPQYLHIFNFMLVHNAYHESPQKKSSGVTSSDLSCHIVSPPHLVHWSGNFWFEEVQSILWWCGSSIILKCWFMAVLANSKILSHVQVPVSGQSACRGGRNQWHDLSSANTIHSFLLCPLYFIMDHGGSHLPHVADAPVDFSRQTVALSTCSYIVFYL
jgi:hypothetical protein